TVCTHEQTLLHVREAPNFTPSPIQNRIYPTLDMNGGEVGYIPLRSGSRWDEGARAVRYGIIVPPSPHPLPAGRGSETPCSPNEGGRKSTEFVACAQAHHSTSTRQHAVDPAEETSGR